MSMSSACSPVGRSSALQDLDRARDGGQGIADLVGDQGRHLAGLGQALPDDQLALGPVQGGPRPCGCPAPIVREQEGDDEEQRPGQEDGVQDAARPKSPGPGRR